MRVTRRDFVAAAAAFLTVAPLGCATVSDKTLLSGKQAQPESSFLDRLPLPGRKKDQKPEPYPSPVKIAVTWTPDTLVQMGRTPTRGFGGRVFFYDEKSRPVPVEGTLTIHGFDDGAPETERGVKRFEFTPEQFTRHFSQSDLGASYSIWIPWDAIGGEQRRISLVASFQSAEGGLIQGIPATILLPGTEPQTTEVDQFAKLSPQYRKYREATESGSTRSTGLTTTTIPRRRGPSSQFPSTEPTRGIAIPNLQEPGTMIAESQPTPAVDVAMVKRALRQTVMPASAQIPTGR